MNLTSESKLIVGIVAATVIVVGIGIALVSRPEVVLSRQDLIPAGTVTKGPPDAKTYLVEFSDLQCPACKEFKPYVDELLAKYPDKLLFAYRHFPLTQHQFGKKAALVAVSAQNQGKFWEMYNYLFANQEKFTEEFLKSSAREIGLDETKFAADFTSDLTVELIDKDIAAGAQFKVNSTPTFFLNGKKLNLSTFDQFLQEVEKEIGKN